MKTQHAVIGIILFHILFAAFGLAVGADKKAVAQPQPAFVYRATVEDVKDGDTIKVNIDLGFRVWKHGETVRLLRVYAPETFKPKDAEEKAAGLKVKAFTVARLAVGKSITIQTKRDGTDKYGRYLAEVWDSDGNVNQAILDFMAANGITPNGANGKNN